MEAGRPSRTALAVAGARAIHQRYDDDPKIFTDPLGARLVEEAAPHFAAKQREHRREPAAIRIRSHMVLRSRFAEDELARAAAGGIQQYVLLGAGLDTFAFRQPPFARNLHIFEVDYPATQAWKRERLASLGLPDPPNLFWAPEDFERQSLLAGLTPAGFDTTQPTYCSWLGVTMYLTRSALDATLQFVTALPPPSSITFDYRLPQEDLAGLDLDTARFTNQAVTSVGEPSLSHYHTDEIHTLLRDLGFSSIFHLTPAEATARYFQGRQDGLRAPQIWQIMCATV